MITRIGKHTVRHGDALTLRGCIDKMLDGGKVDIVYTDPPWQNLKYWQTLNKKMTSAIPLESVPSDIIFLQNVFRTCEQVLSSEGFMFVEYGLKGAGVVKDIVKENGFNLLLECNPTYTSQKRPLSLMIFSRQRATFPDGLGDAIDKTSNYKTLVTATSFLDLHGKTFFDPCCGMGYTAQLAIDNGGTFIGNELNKARLDRTIARLSK